MRTRVGHSFIKAVMAETGAVFGGELSGHFYFRDFWRADSGMLAALHTLSATMHGVVNRADRMLSRQSSLLRMTLGNIGRQEVRLADELAFAEAYLDIERERFGERLELRTAVAPEAFDALVPALFLQPLVENSVRHGFTVPAEDGVVSIGAAREGARLVLTIADNGRGLPAPPSRVGLGLGNTRTRLQQLYGDEHAFDVASRTPSGVLVTVVIPFRTACESEDDTEVVNHGHPDIDRGRRALGADPDRLPARG